MFTSILTTESYHVSAHKSPPPVRDTTSFSCIHTASATLHSIICALYYSWQMLHFRMPDNRHKTHSNELEPNKTVNRVASFAIPKKIANNVSVTNKYTLLPLSTYLRQNKNIRE